MNAMMRIWRWHQLGNTVDQLQWGEHQFTRILVGLQWLAVAFAAAVHQVRTALFETIHGEGWPCTVTQQALQPCAAVPLAPAFIVFVIERERRSGRRG